MKSKIKKVNVLENDKLIANFMGWKEWVSIFYGAGCNINPDIIPDAKNDHSNFCKSEDLLFHLSWNWLMPVIEKIEKKHDVCIWDACYIGFEGYSMDAKETPLVEVGRHESASKIQMVWLAVVEFIKLKKGAENEKSN
jgi:hypothetical protein